MIPSNFPEVTRLPYWTYSNLGTAILPHFIFTTLTGPNTMASTQWVLSKYGPNEQLHKEYVFKVLTSVNINTTLVFWRKYI